MACVANQTYVSCTSSVRHLRYREEYHVIIHLASCASPIISQDNFFLSQKTGSGLIPVYGHLDPHDWVREYAFAHAGTASYPEHSLRPCIGGCMST
jgi:hypothetical protein